jgi:excisionase family DNA binding protein
VSRELGLTVPDELVDALAERVAEKLSAQLAPPASPWLDVKGAAEHLACPTSRVYDLVSLGRLDFRRDGRRLLFRRSDLDAYLDDNPKRKEGDDRPQ